MATADVRGCGSIVAKLVFLVEEPSMADLLNGLLPRLFPGLRFQCVPHSGKNDLDKSIPRKLRGWREPNVCFVVVRDQDSADCHQVKRALMQRCRTAGRTDVLVRVVCRELEAWHVGEPEALACAFPQARQSLVRELRKSRYRNPDAVVRPSNAVARLVPEFQKRNGARRMAMFLSRENRSRSFRALICGIERLGARPSPG